MTYRVVVADFALDPSTPCGKAHDTTALEHVKPDGSLCLVWSTTYPMDLADILRAMGKHDANGCRP